MGDGNFEATRARRRSLTRSVTTAASVWLTTHRELWIERMRSEGYAVDLTCVPPLAYKGDRALPDVVRPYDQDEAKAELLGRFTEALDNPTRDFVQFTGDQTAVLSRTDALIATVAVGPHTGDDRCRQGGADAVFGEDVECPGCAAFVTVHHNGLDVKVTPG